MVECFTSTIIQKKEWVNFLSSFKGGRKLKYYLDIAKKEPTVQQNLSNPFLNKCRLKIQRQLTFKNQVMFNWNNAVLFEYEQLNLKNSGILVLTILVKQSRCSTAQNYTTTALFQLFVTCFLKSKCHWIIVFNLY